MNFDLIPFAELLREKQRKSLAEEAVGVFVRTMDSVFRTTSMIDAALVPGGQADTAEILALAASLRAQGFLRAFHPIYTPPDEPRFYLWRAEYAEKQYGGGISTTSERGAITAALAEAIERKVWSEDVSFFSRSVESTAPTMKKRHIAPERFAGFSPLQREDASLKLDPSASYRWIQGYSWTQREKIYIPAQVISKKYANDIFVRGKEPRIRTVITTGLATGQDRTRALLGGALEIIERDAFMITWSNQISLPRIPHHQLLERSPSLATLLSTCTRYGLSVDFVRLCTDAPAYAICAVVRDSQLLPPITIGLSAHTRPEQAAEKALLEALRARINTRWHLQTHAELAHKDIDSLNSWERSVFWAYESRHEKLRFLTEGPITPLSKEPWDEDTDRAHFERLIAWCEGVGYELASIDMTRSSMNKTPWHIEFVVIPEMQPLHQNERQRMQHGKRMRDVPGLLGYKTLSKPFTATPHPFV